MIIVEKSMKRKAQCEINVVLQRRGIMVMDRASELCSMGSITMFVDIGSLGTAEREIKFFFPEFGFKSISNHEKVPLNRWAFNRDTHEHQRLSSMWMCRFSFSNKTEDTPNHGSYGFCLAQHFLIMHMVSMGYNRQSSAFVRCFFMRLFIDRFYQRHSQSWIVATGDILFSRLPIEQSI